MNEKIKTALRYRKEGYNCTQAVIGVYCDQLQIDRDTAFCLAEGFGSGMGNGQGICGAVSGAVMAAGLKNSSGPSKPYTKAATYKLASKIIQEFQEKNGTLICRELKRGTEGRTARSCEGCIEDAIKAADKVLGGREDRMDLKIV